MTFANALNLWLAKVAIEVGIFVGVVLLWGLIVVGIGVAGDIKRRRRG